MSEQKRQELIKEATKIISNNLGESAANSYRSFYDELPEDKIFLSVGQLLEDFVGPQNSKKQLGVLSKKFNFKLS